MDFLSLFNSSSSDKIAESTSRNKKMKKGNNNSKSALENKYNRNKRAYSVSDKNTCSSESDIETESKKVIINFEEDNLPPEPQLGNIEYKLKLVNPSKQRFEHLVTQMKWRLREGHGEAIYEIGVSDSGFMHGLDEKDMNVSLKTLQEMAKNLGASTTILRKKDISKTRSVTEVLVRKIPDDQHNIEVRIAVLGGADAGKSTLIGVLTQGEYDNGRGRARLNMFRHMHEIQSGRTSSISHETLGFDSNGNAINYKYSEIITAEDISDKSSKLVSFMDLAGHKRYMKTTVQALSGYEPHYAMLVVQTGCGFNGTSIEHLSIASALDMCFFIVVTKIDISAPQGIVDEIKNVLSRIVARKVPFVVRNEDDVLTASSNLKRENTVPIFCVSNVTGAGLDYLTKFLYILSPGVSKAEKERLEQKNCEFQVDEVFKVSDVGLVAGGLLTQGVITENMVVKIGPLVDGSFFSSVIKTIHRNKSQCRVVRAGQSASLSFIFTEKLFALRSGMIILKSFSDEDPFGTIFFQAKITVIYHATAIYVGFQTTVHIGSIRQTAIIRGIMGENKLKTNDSGSVVFQFVCHPEYVRPGMKILFREGRNKGIGKVTQVFPLNGSQRKI